MKAMKKDGIWNVYGDDDLLVLTVEDLVDDSRIKVTKYRDAERIFFNTNLSVLDNTSVLCYENDGGVFINTRYTAIQFE